MGIDVILPVYKPDQKLERLFLKLLSQSLKPDRIILLNTEAEGFENQVISERLIQAMRRRRIYGKKKISVSVTAVQKKEFDHGKTRRRGVAMSDADYFVMMTQDAVPADDYLLERLIGAVKEEGCGAAYARQCASFGSSMVEQCARLFNYPNKSRVKTKEDFKELGIKTYFCSNVCAAYKREAYEQVGGFPEHAIFNEDAVLAARLMEAGYSIAYEAQAKVMHSHNYGLREQFRRNFDLGVSHAAHREIFGGAPPQKEGVRLVLWTLQYLAGQKKYLDIIDLFLQSTAKYLGYQAGKHYSLFPKALVRLFSANPGYFDKKR